MSWRYLSCILEGIGEEERYVGEIQLQTTQKETEWDGGEATQQARVRFEVHTDLPTLPYP